MWMGPKALPNWRFIALEGPKALHVEACETWPEATFSNHQMSAKLKAPCGSPGEL